MNQKQHLLMLAYCLIIVVPSGRPLFAQGGADAPCQAVAFAPELTTAGNVWGSSFDPYARLYTFRQRTGEENAYYIARAERHENGSLAWQRVDLGGEYADLYPALSPDGKHLVFASYRPVPGASARRTSNLWHAQWAGDGWGPPTFMAVVSDTALYESQVYFHDDGTLYYRRAVPDSRDEVTLSTQWTGAAWTEPIVDEMVERWRGWWDGFYLWGGRHGPGHRFVLLDVSPLDPETGRPGASDQWITVREADGTWMEPRPAGCGLNHEGYDNFPFFSVGGDTVIVVQSFERYRAVSVDDLISAMKHR